MQASGLTGAIEHRKASLENDERPPGKPFAKDGANQRTGVQMVPTVSAVALRIALERIAEAATEAVPASIRVATAAMDPRPLYVVSIPSTFRAEVCHYLAQHLDMPFPPDGGPVVVTFRQAEAITELAYRVSTSDATLVAATAVPN
jgi:hypothetical protein